MKVLFAMAYPGYLRYYDATVAELARRGHDVHVAWDLPKKQTEGLAALHALPEVTDLGKTAKRGDLWRPFSMDLRRLTDYVRYLHPRFRESTYLRRRVGKRLPPGWAWLDRVDTLPGPAVTAAVAGLCALEGAIPTNADIDEWLAGLDPDLLVVSPLITVASPQNDLVKSARRAGIPVVAAIASWDHLTTKGRLRVRPDAIVVWNEAQRREAVQLHGVPPDLVAVTGAQPFDRWFGRSPSRDRAAFCDLVGLMDERPFVLFVGSTASISAPEAEVEFVRRWIAELRSGDDAARDLAVLVRPHPYNAELWSGVDLSDLGAAVWPRGGANPADDADRAGYFDSLFHAAAVVGINTSAMIEAAIVGRPVLTVEDERFADTQDGTLHFQHLRPENGGFVRSARSLAEHRRQLVELLEDPERASAEIERFVTTFIRPFGRDVAAVPRVVDVLEDVAAAGPRTPERPSPLALLARILLVVPALVSLRRDPRPIPRTIRRAGIVVGRRIGAGGQRAEALVAATGAQGAAHATRRASRRSRQVVERSANATASRMKSRMQARREALALAQDAAMTEDA